MLWLSLVLSASTPLHDAFVFELWGAPVGLVELSLRDETFTYRSTHVFARGEARATQRFEKSFGASQKPIPSALWIWHRPAPGCVLGVDERSGQSGDLCARNSKTHVSGTLLGQRFTALYDGQGRLMNVSLGSSRFIRTSSAQLPTGGEALFASGFVVPATPGDLRIEGWRAAPGLKAAQDSPVLSQVAARALAKRVAESFTDKSASADDFSQDGGVSTAGACLAHARRFVAWARRIEHAEARVIVGLYAPMGETRAYPHAWVEMPTPEGVLALDPTLDVSVSARTHLALGPLGDVSVGEAYVALASGAARLAR